MMFKTSRFKKHIIVVGSARSGTSWLSEVIARQYRYRMLFEPEHEFNTKKGVLICDQWIRDKTISYKAHRYLKAVFNNRVDNDWIGQISNRKYKMHLWPFVPKKYVIKFVRANLAAKYMNETYKIPVLHVIRNPYDTIASQERVQFPWLYNLEHFKAQKQLVDFVHKTFDFDLLSTDTYSKLEILTIRWCLENVIPLQFIETYTYKHQIVKHEDLRSDINVFFNICNTFDIIPLENIEKEYARPSSKTHPKSSIINKKAKMNDFNEEELEKINTILRLFKCTLYPIKKTL